MKSIEIRANFNRSQLKSKGGTFFAKLAASKLGYGFNLRFFYFDHSVHDDADRCTLLICRKSFQQQ